MKKLFNALGTIAALAVILFSFAGCDGLDLGGNTGSNTGSGTDTYKPVVYAGYSADGTKYELIITRTSKAVVQFTPGTGDSYTLTITTKAGATQTSTGKITVSGTTFTLVHTGTGETFSVTVSANSSSGGTMLSITGDIPIDNSATKVPAPSTLIPPNQTTVAVTGVSLKSTTSLVVGSTETFSAVIDPPAATNKTVTWSSGNGSVATVSTNGTVTAVAAGTATITVKTADGNKTADCVVTVVTSAVAVTGVTLNKSSTSLNSGGTEYLVPAITPPNATNQNVTWTSSNTSVATVSAGGLVTAVAAGTATITVTTVDGNRTATCTVTVTAKTSPPASNIPTFDNAWDFENWLKAQPSNTASTAYNVALNINSLERSTLWDSRNQSTNKYISLDFSGSTFTAIGDGALKDFTTLTGVTIPDSVTSIGESAFFRCASLTSVTIPNGVISIGYYAFGYCTSLTSVTIPNSVTSIGYHAFDSSGLKSITIPDSVTDIRNYVFASCTSLTAINVDSGNNAYTSENGVLYSKNKDIIWSYPAGKTGSFAIPNSVKHINAAAFYGCTGLTGITIPYGVGPIMCDAFRDCTSLASVTIPNSVGHIAEQAFAGCTSLTEVTIPQGVGGIGEGAFADCTSLTAINVAPNNYGGFYSENGAMYWRGENEEGETVVYLMQYPAGKRDNTFTIPDNVTVIYHYAFSGCKSLTGVTIPDGVTHIGQYAFNNSGLTSVTIPNSVIYIMVFAFSCSNLTSVTFQREDTTIANSYSFPSGGSLANVYKSGGRGTYTRETIGWGGTWTKQ